MVGIGNENLSVNYKEGEIISIDCTFDRNYEANPPRCVRPTLNQAMKWLREEKNIYVYIMLHPGGWWEFGFESTTSEEIEDNDMPNMNSSYEKAAEVGIVTALNNLKTVTVMENYKTIILKENTEEIRKMISDAGINVCICSEFKDSDWLNYSTVVGNVHGVGYPDEGMTKEATMSLFLNDLKDRDAVWCKDVDEFISEIKKTKQ